MPQKLSSVTRPEKVGGRREGSASDSSGSVPTVLPTAGCAGGGPAQPARKGIQPPVRPQMRMMAGPAAERQRRRGIIGGASLDGRID